MLSFIEKDDIIFIQMHDNPDADAICSAHLMKLYLNSQGIDGKIIYFGDHIIKPNLLQLMDNYNIEVHLLEEEDHFCHVNLLVDSHYNGGNVRRIEAEKAIELDHHNDKRNLKHPNIVYSQIDPSLGACTSLIYDLFFKDEEINSEVGSLLYYGLLTDTDNFNKPLSKQDIAMKHYLEGYDKIDYEFINILNNENITEEELKLLSHAIIRMRRIPNVPNIAVVEMIETCTQNLLGQISDTILTVAGINIVLVATKINERIYRFSIRSYNRKVKAFDIVKELVYFEDIKIGEGGGSMDRVGGVLFKDILDELVPHQTLESFLTMRLSSIYLSKLEE